MTKRFNTACIVAGGIGLATSPGVAQISPIAEQHATADTVARLFEHIAEATNSLDLDRLLGYYERSEALTYVAQGRVTRSYDAFSGVLHAQLGGLSGTDLRWVDTYVDVLSSDVAVATATYEFTATFPNGDSARSTGTYMCIYVRGDVGWLVRYSAHSFPPPAP